VLLHLVRNAVRFSPDHSQVSIKVLRYDLITPDPSTKRFRLNTSESFDASITTKSKFLFRISNNTAEAVNMKNINESFRNYYSSLNTPTDGDSLGLTSVQGVGLGLYVAFQLVQSMGGLLECSQTPDRTVTFSFELVLGFDPNSINLSFSNTNDPSLKASGIEYKMDNNARWTNAYNTEAAAQHVIDDDSASVSTMATDRSKNSSSVTGCDVSSADTMDDSLPVRKRVLIVDDSPMCQRVLAKILTNKGCDIDTAANGKEACDKLFIEPCLYDVVLMDLRMPIMVSPSFCFSLLMNLV
jgi:CheY-like chemotaxis protein